MSLPPAFPASFYRLLSQGAQQLGISRVRLATEAVRHYLKAQKQRSTPTAQVLPEELVKQFAATRRKLAKRWWDQLSDEEKKKRAQRAAAARWGKKQ